MTQSDTECERPDGNELTSWLFYTCSSNGQVKLPSDNYSHWVLATQQNTQAQLFNTGLSKVTTVGEKHSGPFYAAATLLLKPPKQVWVVTQNHDPKV